MSGGIWTLFGRIDDQVFWTPDKRDEVLKADLEKIERNRLRTFPDEPRAIVNKYFVDTHYPVREVPIVISSSDAVGTIRARARHYEAYLDYFQEEEALKIARAPIFPVFIR